MHLNPRGEYIGRCRRCRRGKNIRDDSHSYQAWTASLILPHARSCWPTVRSVGSAGHTQEPRGYWKGEDLRGKHKRGKNTGRKQEDAMSKMSKREENKEKILQEHPFTSKYRLFHREKWAPDGQGLVGGRWHQRQRR